jgi:hypothetical protein
VRDGGFRRLLQQDAETLAANHAVRGERVGEAVRQALDVEEAVGADAAILALEDQRGRIGRCGRMAVAGIDTDVVVRRHPPFEGGAQRVVGGGFGQHGTVS